MSRRVRCRYRYFDGAFAAAFTMMIRKICPLAALLLMMFAVTADADATLLFDLRALCCLRRRHRCHSDYRFPMPTVFIDSRRRKMPRVPATPA